MGILNSLEVHGHYEESISSIYLSFSYAFVMGKSFLFVLPILTWRFFNVIKQQTRRVRNRKYQQQTISHYACVYLLSKLTFHSIDLGLRVGVWERHKICLFPCDLLCVISIFIYFLLAFELQFRRKFDQAINISFQRQLDTPHSSFRHIGSFVCIIFGHWINWTMIFQFIWTAHVCV